MPVDPEVRRLALGALLLGFIGPTPPSWLLDALADGLGGVVLFSSNLGGGSRLRELTDALRSAAGRDVVIALDEEGGDVTRIDAARGSASPGAAALGHLDDVVATEQTYAAVGGRLASAGATLNLAPVADVNVDTRNPVIGVRSFSAHPDVVARHVRAAVRGLQWSGIAACAKHFPGHGATITDSHLAVPTLHRTRAELDAVELPPFAAAIDAGVRAVMTGHLLVPAVDPDNIATASSAITTKLLRGRLGFTGAVVSDALEMRALAGTLGMERGFVAAVAAGADAIEPGAHDYPRLVSTIPEAAQRALRAGALSVDRLRDAAERTAQLAVVRPELARAATTGPGTTIAARCLEVIGQLPALDRPLVAEARPPEGMATGELPWSLAEPLAQRMPGVTAIRVSGPTAASTILERARERGLVVVVREVIRYHWQAPLLVAAARHPSAVVVDVGWPSDLPPAVPAVRTRGIAPGLLTAAADLLTARRRRSR